MSESPETKRKKIENEEEMKAEVEEHGNDPSFFRLKVDDIRERKDGDSMHTDDQLINGLPMYISVGSDCKDDNVWYLNGYLHCYEYDEVCSNFFFNFSIDFKVVNFIDSSKSKLATGEGRISTKDDSSPSFYLIDWEEMIDERNGFIQNGEIIVEAKVRPGRYGIKFLSQFDFSAPSEFSDVILVVEGKKVHVNKQILARQSCYFKALFFGNFKESNESEIELKDLNHENFITFLKLIYGESIMFKWEMDMLLQLFDRFDCEELKYKAELFLIEKPFDLVFSIALASEYRLGFVLIISGDSTRMSSEEHKDSGDATFFRLKVENIRNLNEEDGQYGDEHIINGLPMEICVNRNETIVIDGEWVLSGGICCMPEEVTTAFFFNSIIDFKLVNFMDDSKSICTTEEDNFTPKSSFCTSDLIDWNELIDEANGFIKDGAIIIEAKVTPGRWKVIPLPQFDFSVPSEMSDVTLIVGSNKFYVSKQILAHHSSYFKALFFGYFKESKQSEIELKDIHLQNRWDFHNFLQLMYGDEAMSDWYHLKPLLPLFDRFDCERFKYDAQACIMSSSFAHATKLTLACKYRFHFVLEDCLAKLDSLVKIRKVIESGEYNFLSSDIKDELQKKMKSLEDPTGSRKVKKTVKTIKINGRTKMRDIYIPQITFDFSGPDEISDAILVVEGQKVHVSTQILALQSSYFKSLFFGNNKQSKESEIELKDLLHEDFIILLNVLYGDKTKLDWSHMKQLLPLLEKFGCEKLNYEAQVCVMEKPGIDIKTKIDLAREYNLHFLMDYCIAKLDTPAKMRICMSSVEYRNLPEDIKEELQRKMKHIEKQEERIEEMSAKRMKMMDEEEEEDDDDYVAASDNRDNYYHLGDSPDFYYHSDE